MYICIKGYKRLHKERMKWLVCDLIKASLLVFLYVFHMTFLVIIIVLMSHIYVHKDEEEEIINEEPLRI